MASSYSNTGIELIATGEQANTWGITTNTNWELIEEEVSGVVSIALTGSTYTLTTSNGASSEGRHMVVVFTGSPGATCTVTVSPNDLQKTYYIDNQTNQTVTLTQGTGGNVNVLAGTRAVVYCDGAGAGAEVVEILGSQVSALSDLTPGDGDFIVGNGTTWVTESGNTVRASLGLTIGTNVQAWDAQLDNFSNLAPTNDHWIYANGTSWTSTTGAGKLQTWTGKITTDGEIEDATFVGSVTEETYSLSGTTVDPTNGTIQYKTLTGDTTITLDMEDGQSATLMIKATDPATSQTHDVIWADTIDWKTEGGNPPTMNVDTYTVIVVWKLGSDYYGARVGDA